MADETYTKADLDKAVKDAIEEATKGLKDNLTAALDEAKDAKRKLRAASEIKPEDLTAAEERADKAEAKVKELEKAAKDATAAKEKAEKALEGESAFTRQLLVENGLREQLVANGVTNAVHQKAAIALLGSQVAVTADGEARVAKVGDKPLADFVKEWAGGDEGKHFVSAPANSGGGAPGGKKGEAGKTMTRAAFDALDPTAKATAGLEASKGELQIVDA
jgi:hypothetical protein